MLLKIIFLIKAIFLEPSVVFKKINSREISTEVYWLFSVSALIVFLKTLSLQKDIHINFFENRIDSVLSLLANPHVAWFVNYAFYFLFIVLISLLFKLLLRKSRIKTLFLSLMSISAMGIVFQVLFFIGQSIPANTAAIIKYSILLWVIILSLLAIKIST